MRNIYLIIGLIILMLHSSCQAFVFEDKTELQNYRLSNIFLQLSQKQDKESLFIYEGLITKLENALDSVEKEEDRLVLSEIISKMQLRKKSLTESIKKVNRHKSLILKFWAGAESTASLELKREEIKNIESVFIFRNGTIDLPGYQIESITAKLLEINPDILIFIDQEGGLINRYIEFDASISFANYLSSDTYIKETYNTFSEETRIGLGYLFPQNYNYFPSMRRVGEIYQSVTQGDKENFLDIVAYLRLKSLQDRGINTYGLVMDLDRGNPVIQNYKRSFSGDLEDYKKLGDAFIKASKKTGVSLYLKHFPGHGAGQVDSHKGILDYTNYSSYLGENLELFEYMLDNKQYTQIGLMIGHMYIPKTLKSEFTSIIDKSDYLLTDDLAMRGYTLATGAIKSEVFFTTDVVFDNDNTILVDSLLNPQIK